MQVSSLLSGKHVQTIAPDATIKELSQSLAELKIGALVVSSDGRNILGIVSERDIVQALPREVTMTVVRRKNRGNGNFS